jgi:hypothetical protein
MPAVIPITPSGSLIVDLVISAVALLLRITLGTYDAYGVQGPMSHTHGPRTKMALRNCRLSAFVQE